MIVSVQHMIIRFFIYFRMERQRREEELKNRSSKKGQDAEQVILNRVGCLYYTDAN